MYISPSPVPFSSFPVALQVTVALKGNQELSPTGSTLEPSQLQPRSLLACLPCAEKTSATFPMHQGGTLPSCRWGMKTPDVCGGWGGGVSLPPRYGLVLLQGLCGWGSSIRRPEFWPGAHRTGQKGALALWLPVCCSGASTRGQVCGH